MLGGPYDLIGEYNLLAAAGSANQPYPTTQNGRASIAERAARFEHPWPKLSRRDTTQTDNPAAGSANLPYLGSPTIVGRRSPLRICYSPYT
jgi:hypothetical protein